jgi:HEAT repeat protein
LAKALAKSKNTKTADDVLELLNDANVNVVSMAYLALAQRGEAQAISVILRKIKASDSWYSQMYAYRALRALGWYQDRSL